MLALHSPAFPLECAAYAARRRRTVVFQRVDHQPLHHINRIQNSAWTKGFCEEWWRKWRGRRREQRIGGRRSMTCGRLRTRMARSKGQRRESQEMQYAHEMQCQDWTRIGAEPTGDRRAKQQRWEGKRWRQRLYGLEWCKRLHGLATEEKLLGHSQYWSWCRHCVDGHGVGQRHVPSEVESGALPMIVMD